VQLQIRSYGQLDTRRLSQSQKIGRDDLWHEILNIIDIQKHFSNFQETIQRLNIRTQDIWNFDETGFRIGCLQSQLVFTRVENKAVYISDPENRELVTSMECISADGRSINPMIIMAGIVFKEKHFDNNLNGQTLLAMSESGYTNDMLSYEWIKHFNRETKEGAQNRQRLLVMDGHGSHLTREFVTYCYENRITPFLLPPHSTHLLQPLDIGVFQSFKHYHQEVLEESIRFGGIDYNKTDFLASFRKMRDLTFKQRVIRSAFKKAGLVPYNPQIVLDQLRTFNPPVQPTTPPASESTNHIQDFTVSPALNLEAIQKYSEYINTRLSQAIVNHSTFTADIATVIQKRDKAMMTLTLSGRLAEEELHAKRAAELEKTRRKSGNRQVQTYGTIYANDGRLRIAARNQAEDDAKAAIEARKDHQELLKQIRRESECARKEEVERIDIAIQLVSKYYPKNERIGYHVRRRYIKVLMELRGQSQLIG